MKKGIIICIISLAVIAAGVFAAMQFLGKPKQYSAEAAKYESISDEVEVSGDIKGEKTTTYYSEVTAPVSDYDVNVGDIVMGEQVVLLYDTADLNKALEQALLTAQSSENSMNGQIAASNKKASLYNQAVEDSNVYMNLYALVRMNNDSIDQNDYQEKWDVACVADNIQRSMAGKERDIAQKYIDIQNRTNELSVTTDPERIKQLNDEINSLKTDTAVLEKDIAALQYDYAALPSQTLTPSEYAKEVINGNWMSDIMRNWTQATTVKNTYEAQILNSYQKDQLQNTYDLSELNVITAQENIAKALMGVSADYNGIVTESFVKNGSLVAKGSPLFTIESCDDLKVEVGVSKYDIGKIEKGQRAIITIAGREYEGYVSEIKRLATVTNSDKAKVAVSVHINNPDENVYLGLEADVTIYTNEKEGAIVIPSNGYYEDDEGDYCYLIRNGEIEKQYITIGIESDDYIEALEGIRVGDVIITDAITDSVIGKKAVAR